MGTLDNALAEGSGFQKVLDAHHALYSAEKPPRPDFLSDSGKLALEALSVLTLIKTQLVPLPANYQQLCEAVKLLKPLSKSTLKDWWAVGRHYLEVAYSSNLAEVAFQTTGSPGRTNKCDAIDSIKRSFYTIAEVFSVLQSGRQ